MRPLLLVLLSTLLAACCSVAEPAAPSGYSPMGLARQTVALVELGEDGPRAYCAGVWVDADLILTAEHCVADLLDLEPVYYASRDDAFEGWKPIDYKPRFGSVLLRDEAHDLALIRVPSAPAHPVAEVDPMLPEMGAEVSAVGHPLGLWWSYSRGYVAAIRQGGISVGEGMQWVQATTPISPGNSGGGLWDDEGHLIGITSATFTRGQNLNIFIGPRHIVELLRKVPRGA